MTHTIDFASRAVLIAFDPEKGRRPDLQRLGPMVRAVGLADLLHSHSVVDTGASVQSRGEVPSSSPLATIWHDCSTGATWNAAVRKNGRQTVRACEQVLANEGLLTVIEKGFGPLRSRSARPTAAGERLAELWRTQVRADLTSDSPTAPAAALHLALSEYRLTGVLGSSVAAPVTSNLPTGLASAIKRVALDRRVMILT